MPSIQALLLKWILRRARGRAVKHLGDVRKMRIGHERLLGRLKPAKGVKFEYTSIAGIPCMWSTPKVKKSEALLFYIHGGGFATGSYHSHKSLISKLALETGRRTLSMNYRLAPEHPFPAGLEDCAAVYAQLLSSGVHPQSIAFVGDSAGGNLVLALLFYLRDNKTALPNCAVVFSPWTDLAGTSHSIISRQSRDPFIIPDRMLQWARWYSPTQPLTHPLVSPIYGCFEGLPPILVQVGGDEILRDDSLRLRERAQAANADLTVELWKGMTHVWQMSWRYLPEARRAIAVVVRFIQAQEAKAQQLHPIATIEAQDLVA